MTSQSRRLQTSPARAQSAMNIELLRQEGSERVQNRKLTRSSSANQDFFIERAGVRCAGAHLIIDLYDADRLDDLELMERTLRQCVDVAGATLLHIHLHPFEPNGGISGVAVLAESHISVHTWPELQYAALDVFMCGGARPERCIEVLLEAFTPRRVAVEELLRGRSA
jgi:S-adenosylmethionine decarboxylase